MFKKALACFVSVVIIAFATALPAAAQSESSVEARVFVDGQQVAFDVQPLTEEGTTLVQFRPIFEKLGLTIVWDEKTKTVTGRKDGLSVELTIGSDQAKVNGQVRALALPPRIANDHTLVPLRFVGEAAGKDVHWDGYSKLIRIAGAEDNIKAVIESNMAFTESRNFAGVLSTLDENAQSYGNTAAIYKQMFTMFQLDYTLDRVIVKEVKGNSAKAEVGMTVKKINGPEFKDNRSIGIQTFHKKNGSWKLADTAVIRTDFMNADQYKDEKPALSEADRKSILELVEQARRLSQEEDFVSLRTLYDPAYPNLENMFAASKYMAASYDLKFEVSDVSIIQVKDDIATVRYKQKMSRVSGPAFNDTVADGVTLYKKQSDGNWKIVKDDIITTEALQSKE